jgi:hypothetical protein
MLPLSQYLHGTCLYSCTECEPKLVGASPDGHKSPLSSLKLGCIESLSTHKKENQLPQMGINVVPYDVMPWLCRRVHDPCLL